MKNIKDFWADDESEINIRHRDISSPKKNNSNKGTKKCFKCGFKNNKDSRHCENCLAKFYADPNADRLKIAKNKLYKVLDFSKAAKKIKSGKIVILNTGSQLKRTTREKISRLFNFKKHFNFNSFSAIIFLGISLALWTNRIYINSEDPAETSLENISVSRTFSCPMGLYNYGGAISVYPALVSAGLHSSLEQICPAFGLRYSQPLTQNNSHKNPIRMLVDGDLSLSFSARSVSDAEYDSASKRGVRIQQTAIAIDAITFYGNSEMPIKGLTTDQIFEIFTGKLSNWNQINSDIGDLPIIPVVLNAQDLAELSLIGINPEQIPKNSINADTYTEAVRKVLATEGAISYSSASLIHNQSLIQVFPISGENKPENFVPAVINGFPNLEGFKNNQYPFTRNVYFNRKIYYNPEEDKLHEEAAGEAYLDYLLSEKGKTVIEKAGYVPF